MNQHEMIEGLAAAGHDVSSYACEVKTLPPRKPKNMRLRECALTLEDLSKLIFDAAVKVCKKYHEKQVAPLQKRIAELEARPQMQYVGVWESGRQYHPGECVTDQGSVFHCNRETTERPGTGSGAWTLAVKRGRDGREANPRGPHGTAQPR